MINNVNPVQANVKAANQLPAKPEVKKEAAPKAAAKENDTFEKQSPMDAVYGIRNKFLNLAKRINNLTGVSKGTVLGVVAGDLAGAASGIVTKNIIKSKGQIGGAVAGTIKDSAKAFSKIFTKAIPALWNQSLKDNLKSLLNSPAAFYKYTASGLEKNKGVAGAVATVVGAGVLAFNVVKGKMSANHNNAEIDHYTNSGHIKTK